MFPLAKAIVTSLLQKIKIIKKIQIMIIKNIKLIRGLLFCLCGKNASFIAHGQHVAPVLYLQNEVKLDVRPYHENN